MTVKEFIENFNIIDRNVYIYPKTVKDLTNSDGDRSPYILAIHKYKNQDYLGKSVKRFSKRLSRPNMHFKGITQKNYTLDDILNAEVWRVSTDCSWYDRVPPICLYIKDIELLSKSQLKVLDMAETIKDSADTAKDSDLADTAEDSTDTEQTVEGTDDADDLEPNTKSDEPLDYLTEPVELVDPLKSDSDSTNTNTDSTPKSSPKKNHNKRRRR